MSPLIRRSIQLALIVFMASVVAIVVTFAVYPPIGAIGILAMGRGPEICSLAETVASFRRSVRQSHYVDQHFPNVKLVRTDGRFQQVESPWGPFWEPKTTGTVVTAQLAEFDAKYEDFGDRPVKPGAIVIDCGANVGTFSRMALRSGAAKVIAVEPAPVNIEVLRRNFAKEIESGQVVVVPKGVWNTEGAMTLNFSQHTEAMDSLVLDRGGKQGVEVSLTTVDKLVAELQLPRVDFMKIDTEGAERQILTGAMETLRRWKPRLEISFHLPDDPVKLPAILLTANAGYRKRCLLCRADWRAWRIDEDILFFE